jgi:hypothetical protein
MKRVWAVSTLALCAAVSLSPAAAQTPELPGIEIFRGPTTDQAPAAGPVQPRLLRIPASAPEGDAKTGELSEASLAGVDASPAAALAGAPTQAAAVAVMRAAAEAVAPALAAAQRRAIPPERTRDLNRIVLTALACSTGCAPDDAGMPGAALTAVSADGATAQQQAVAEAFRNLMAPVWIEQQQRAIEMIGYYSAAAALCENSELNPEDVARVVQANFSLAPDASEEQLSYRHDALTMHIGMATGMAMGAHMDRLPAFCAEARANRYNFATPLLRDDIVVRAAQLSPLPAPPPPLARPEAP